MVILGNTTEYASRIPVIMLQNTTRGVKVMTGHEPGFKV